MRYSIVNDERAEVQPGLKGVCQCCGGQLQPKEAGPLLLSPRIGRRSVW